MFEVEVGTRPAARRRVRLMARLEEMARDEAPRRIGATRYLELAANDSSPMFVELLAGHEGVSTGAIAAPGARKRRAGKLWSRDRIRELVERLNAGAPVFLSHGASSGRRPIGALLSAAERWVDGLLGAAAVASIHDPEAKRMIRAGELDSCSIEADVELSRAPEDRGGLWMVDAIRKVTGVALGSSRLEKPGFPRAAILAATAEFEATGELIVAGAGESIGADAARGATGASPAPHPRDPEDERRAEKRPDLMSELAALRIEAQRRRREDRAEAIGERLLLGKNVTPAEEALILRAVRKAPSETDDGLEASVKQKVERELARIDRAKRRRPAPINAPAERRDRPANPLIPTP